MKKALTLILAVALALPSFSRTSRFPHRKGGDQWIIIGARGTFNSTWLLNKNWFNDKGLKYQASFGGGGGIMLGFHFSEWGAIEVEGLYSIMNQKLASNIDSVNWNSKTNLTYLEFPILLHFDTENFKYIEVGVKIGMLSGAQSTYNNSKYSAFNYADKNTKDNYESTNLALVFGWGSGVWGNGGLLINLGIRLSYGLSDIVSTTGGKGKDYFPSDGSGVRAAYAPTNTATVGIHMNMDFDLGWFVTSSCKRNHKFVLFGH